MERRGRLTHSYLKRLMASVQNSNHRSNTEVVTQICDEPMAKVGKLITDKVSLLSLLLVSDRVSGEKKNVLRKRVGNNPTLDAIVKEQ